MKVKRIITSSLLSMFCAIIFAQETVAKQLVDELVNSNKTVGVSAAYMANDSIMWLYASGYADKTSNKKFQPSTINRIASISKPITAVAIMQLVEQGKIDLNKSIQTYVPEFPKKKKGTITVRHLLEHSSGIKGYKNSKERQNEQEYATLLDAMHFFKDRKLDFKPGTAYGYTTYGYVVLGVIIERASNQTYASYIQENILDKAGMTNTGIVKYQKPHENQSSLYHNHHKKGIVDGVENNLSNRIPGGGYYSTVEDLLKFAKAIINNTLISRETLNSMLLDNGLKDHGNPYGFGFLMYNPKPNISALIGHGGEQTGVSSQLMIMPDHKIASVVLANTSGSYKEVIQLSARLIDAFNQKKD